MPDELNRRRLVVGSNRDGQRLSRRVRADALLELRPMRQTVFASDDELSIAQAKRARGDGRIVRLREFRMTAPDAVQRLALAVTPLLEKLARLPLWNVEMGSLRDSPRYGSHNLSS